MTARLRRTFKYPSDADLDAEASDLDEIEQETLIANLQSQTTSTDTLYVRIFTILPLVCIPAFLYFFFRPSSSPTVRFLCILALTSLLASSLSVYLTPLGPDGKVSAAGVIELPVIGNVDSDGPLGKRIPALNALICALLSVASMGMKRRAGTGGISDEFWLFCLVPGVVLGVIFYVKRTIGEVQGGIRELKEMSYGLKGA